MSFSRLALLEVLGLLARDELVKRPEELASGRRRVLGYCRRDVLLGLSQPVGLLGLGRHRHLRLLGLLGYGRRGVLCGLSRQVERFARKGGGALGGLT